jgi:hypothetical protein
VPDVFKWLCQSPVVLEGILAMVEVNVASAGVRLGLLKEAAAIAVASRAMPGSGLRTAVEQLMPEGSWSDPCAVGTSDSSLESVCRRYAWQVANAAHTISDEQIRLMSKLGLEDAELLDLTLAAALFSALAIIEPISAAAATKAADVTAARNGQVPSALREDLAI